MNRVYRLVWNRHLRAVQVASELASSRSSGMTSTGAARPRQRALAIACMTVFALAWAGAGHAVTSYVGAPGGSGAHGTLGSAGAGGSATGLAYAGGTGSITAGTPTYTQNPQGTSGLSVYSQWGVSGGGGGSGGGTGGASGDAGVRAGQGGAFYLTGTGGGGGGAGGTGSPDGTAGGGGGGGGGDVGRAVASSLVGGSLTDMYTGGSGGAGGHADAAGAGAGGGGGGGTGLLLSADTSTAVNVGSAVVITGGAGGKGGDAYAGVAGGGGGAGGAGMVVLGNGPVNMFGAITGGIGGRGGQSGTGSATLDGNAGGGGVGLLMTGGSNVSVYGTVAGGWSGDGAKRASAVYIAGAGNQLVLAGGASLDGNLTLGAGSSATFVNLQSGAFTNNMALGAGSTLSLVSGQQQSYTGIISGGGALRVSGSGIALTGANTYSGGTVVDGPTTLTIANDGNLGDASAMLTLINGGQLAVSGAWNTARNILVKGPGSDNAITTQGDVTLGGAIEMQTALSIDAGSHAIVAVNAGNQLNGDLTLIGKNINVSSGSNLSVVSLDAKGSAVTLTSQGTLSVMTPVLADTGAVTLTAKTGALMVSGSITGGDVALSGTGVFLQDVQARNTLAITSTTGNLVQASGGWLSAGDVSLHANNGGITITNGSNSFGGNVSATARDGITLTTASALNLGTINGSSLQVSSMTGLITLNGNIHTLGYQSYANAVTLRSDADLSSTLGNLAFGGPVDGAHSLTVSGNTISFQDAVGSTTRLTSLTSSGNTSLAGDVSTSGDQSYYGNVTFGRDTTLSGAQVYLGYDVSNSYGLTINGKLITGSTIGASAALTYLQVNGDGRFGGSIYTTGAVNVTGATTLASNVVIQSTSSDVHLGNVDGSRNLSLQGRQLTVGTVGAVTALDTFTLTGQRIAIDGDIRAVNLRASSANDVAIDHDLYVAQSIWLYGAPSTHVTYGVTGTVASGQISLDPNVTLDIGKGTATGTLSGPVVVAGALAFTRTTDSTYSGMLTGPGSVTKSGVGALTLEGNSGVFLGATTVQGGSLIVGGSAGSNAKLGGAVSVDSGATIGGHGTLTGSLNVNAGGHVAPGNSVGTLTVNGNVALQAGSQLDFELGRPGATLATPGTGDQLVVGGALANAGGTININDAGGFGAGLYTLIKYNSLASGSLPFTLGMTPAGQTVKLVSDTSQSAINLINSTGVALQMWNANGLASSTRLGGGSGTWSMASPVWASEDGSIVGIMQPAPGYAVFGGDAGVVTVDSGAGQVGATGMQFATDGYVMNGDALALGGTATIRVGNGGTSGTDMTATIDNVLTGSAGLTKTDYGTLVLNGSNTFVGDVSVLGGRVSVSSNDNLGVASNAVLLDGGTLQITGAALSAFSRQVTLGSHGGGLDILGGLAVSLDYSLDGTGGLVKDGGGSLSLLNGASYTGGTTIRAGTLLANSDTLHGDVTNDAQLVMQQAGDGAYAGAISGGGSLQKTGNGMLTLTGANSYSGGTTISSGTLVGDAASLQGAIRVDGALVFDQAVDGVYAGVLSGAGAVSKSGNGTLVFNGHSSNTGRTQVQAGKLVIGDDNHGDAFLGGVVTVANGATLGGIGSIGGLNLAGTVTPGNSIGTLTINGDATFQKGSAYQVDVNPDGTSDRIVVNGHATLLGGSALAIGPANGWAPSTNYTILTATGGITGKFDTVSSQLAFLTPTLSYGSNAITLQLMRNDIQFAQVATTANQKQAGSAAESLGIDSPLFQQLLTQDAATARASFDQLSGEIFASTRTALIDDSRYVRDAVNRRLLGTDDGGQGSHATNADGVTAWTSVWGHWGDKEGDGNAARATANGGGVLLGGDLTVGNDARLGALVGHGQSSAKIADRHSDAHATTTWAGLYGDARFGRLSVRGAASYGWHDVDSNRTPMIGETTSRLGASYHASSWQAYAEGSVDLAVGERQTLAPFLNLAHVQLDTDGAREHGGVAALRAPGDSSAVSYGTLGLRDTWQSTTGVSVHAGLGWQMAWGDRAPTSRMQFVEGGNVFGVAGVPVAQHAAVIDAGISFPLSQHARIDASYLGQFASDARDQAARVSLVVSF
ncbi:MULTISPECIES: autotransporter outer membrane beta-barrel domain-containing protein [Dyella]|uniref:Autotransporter outer membrane beta-barrel domain-containing protein n=2 Tax=Dyella TaxID=231454 RepID=A0A4R0YJ88_9GAMM|nr:MULTISPECIES: autotransporter outer membrane beta-barrel domain-containing protein [Dyella]TBR36276.1 autotransporter outer membrane beta-barrel domain-containing protein [Dyella terrae]TCI05932.1 autotransporter outer membrane beta-barrel domain-containing protein [Dyella soli]